MFEKYLVFAIDVVFCFVIILLWLFDKDGTQAILKNVKTERDKGQSQKLPDNANPSIIWDDGRLGIVLMVNSWNRLSEYENQYLRKTWCVIAKPNGSKANDNKIKSVQDWPTFHVTEEDDGDDNE